MKAVTSELKPNSPIRALLSGGKGFMLNKFSKYELLCNFSLLIITVMKPQKADLFKNTLKNNFVFFYP